MILKVSPKIWDWKKKPENFHPTLKISLWHKTTYKLLIEEIKKGLALSLFDRCLKFPIWLDQIMLLNCGCRDRASSIEQRGGVPRVATTRNARGSKRHVPPKIHCSKCFWSPGSHPCEEPPPKWIPSCVFHSRFTTRHEEDHPSCPIRDELVGVQHGFNHKWSSLLPQQGETLNYKYTSKAWQPNWS